MYTFCFKNISQYVLVHICYKPCQDIYNVKILSFFIVVLTVLINIRPNYKLPYASEPGKNGLKFGLWSKLRFWGWDELKKSIILQILYLLLFSCLSSQLVCTKNQNIFVPTLQVTVYATQREICFFPRSGCLGIQEN